ncbi:U-scoloptoxin(16)-Er12a-like isoform X1 [Gigantopelta aegis]|uniref:U-scoloptoxin(16)-Er12a-like isoform X1 n=1 Tax=Gigantopelta aegis TaxID=1735272 RepID=UPI001B88BE85|nr:U-scoloptoxin(16)-Er12a-like isoform X1 [Gigantopelta aegis]
MRNIQRNVASTTDTIHSSWTTVLGRQQHSRGNCTDAKGIHHKDGDVWYPRGECAKYGCFIRNDVLVRYKESCPDYPAPDCRFHLKSDPLGPFPECCYVPRCNTG